MRNSVWPHPFVINNYYLGHTLPLQMVLPMASSPLLVTCATGAGDICVWRLHGGALLQQWTGEWLQRACEAGPSREHFEGIGLLLRHGLPLESS